MLKRWAATWGIGTEHFDPHRAARERGPRVRRPLEEVLVDGSTYSRGQLKERLYDEGLKERRCELCGQGEEWRGRRLSLILDHVNGVSTDNRLENLQVVCPNCAATLDTHCGRNAELVHERPCLHCGEVFRPRYGKQRFCSLACSARHTRGHEPRPETRKVERPPYEQLLRETRELGFSATGRKYGVSDNAVRKWLRWYAADEERRRAA